MNLELSLWIGALIGGLIVAIIASSKGHGVTVVLWFFFGALLFPVALTAILCAERAGKNCPECVERIYLEARKCPFCQSEQVFEVN